MTLAQQACDSNMSTVIERNVKYLVTYLQGNPPEGLHDLAGSGRVRLLRARAQRPLLDVLLLRHCRKLLLQLLPPRPVRLCTCANPCFFSPSSMQTSCKLCGMHAKC